MREKKKNTPFLKKSPGEKSNTPLFLQFSGRTLSQEKYPFTGHFGNTHAVIPTSEWGGRACYTVKPVNKDHSRETRKVVFIGRWSVCIGAYSICFNEKPFSRETENVVFVDRWLL